jgi:hypothetical protein
VVEFLKEVFFAIGLCFILKYGTILNLPRNFLSRFSFFKNLLNCCLCLGFHVGFWIGFLKNYDVIQALYCGFYIAGICWLADCTVMLLRKYA